MNIQSTIKMIKKVDRPFIESVLKYSKDQLSNSQTVKSKVKKTKSKISGKRGLIIDKEYKPLEKMSVAQWMEYQQKNIVFDQVSWLGQKTVHNILDLWIYQEIISETKPDVIIEIGSLHGGTTLFLAQICDLLGHGTVASVEIKRPTDFPKHARIVKDELKRRSRNGTTVFLSTHLLNVAEELADRVGIISEGRLIALGTVDQIRATVSATIPEMESLESLFLQLTATPER